jgi:hypothetical protein
MNTTTPDHRIVDTHRRIRNILNQYPASAWTAEESQAVLNTLAGIVRARQAEVTR